MRRLDQLLKFGVGAVVLAVLVMWLVGGQIVGVHFQFTVHVDDEESQLSVARLAVDTRPFRSITAPVQDDLSGFGHIRIVATQIVDCAGVDHLQSGGESRISESFSKLLAIKWISGFQLKFLIESSSTIVVEINFSFDSDFDSL